jgi:CDP-glucose 4,6-dehydratase
LDILVNRRSTLLSKEDHKKIKVQKGSVADLKLVNKIVRQNRIEFIFHLAAEALVGNCLVNPLKAFSSNIEGTWNVLEAVRTSKSVQAVVIASSDKAYGSHEKLPYDEGFCLQGDHPYDVSKSCTDLLAHTYFNTYKTPVSITRCGNIYGPGDFNFSRIVPDTIRCALSNKTLAIRSDGKFTRDYVFVDDIVNGYMLLAEKLFKNSKFAGEAFNFSYEQPLSVLELVKKIYVLSGKKPSYKILNRAKYEIKDQYLNSSKARRVLGFRPKFAIDQGLKTTIDWYRENL